MWGRHSNRQEQELAGDVVVHTQEEEGIGKGLAKNPRCPRTAMHTLQLQLQTSTNSPTSRRPSVPHTYSNNTFIESSGSLSHYLLFCKVGKLKDPGNRASSFIHPCLSPIPTTLSSVTPWMSCSPERKLRSLLLRMDVTFSHILSLP